MAGGGPLITDAVARHDQLPAELLQVAGLYLDTEDLRAARLACKAWAVSLSHCMRVAQLCLPAAPPRNAFMQPLMRGHGELFMVEYGHVHASALVVAGPTCDKPNCCPASAPSRSCPGIGQPVPQRHDTAPAHVKAVNRIAPTWSSLPSEGLYTCASLATVHLKLSGLPPQPTDFFALSATRNLQELTIQQLDRPAVAGSTWITSQHVEALTRLPHLTSLGLHPAGGSWDAASTGALTRMPLLSTLKALSITWGRAAGRKAPPCSRAAAAAAISEQLPLQHCLLGMTQLEQLDLKGAPLLALPVLARLEKLRSLTGEALVAVDVRVPAHAPKPPLGEGSSSSSGPFGSGSNDAGGNGEQAEGAAAAAGAGAPSFLHQHHQWHIAQLQQEEDRAGEEEHWWYVPHAQQPPPGPAPAPGPASPPPAVPQQPAAPPAAGWNILGPAALAHAEEEEIEVPHAPQSPSSSSGSSSSSAGAAFPLLPHLTRLESLHPASNVSWLLQQVEAPQLTHLSMVVRSQMDFAHLLDHRRSLTRLALVFGGVHQPWHSIYLSHLPTCPMAQSLESLELRGSFWLPNSLIVSLEVMEVPLRELVLRCRMAAPCLFKLNKLIELRRLVLHHEVSPAKGDSAGHPPAPCLVVPAKLLPPHLTSLEISNGWVK